MCSIKFAILTAKYLSWSLFLIKLSAFRPENLLERDSNTGVFLRVVQIFIEHHRWLFLSVDEGNVQNWAFAEFLRKAILKNGSELT